MHHQDDGSHFPNDHTHTHTHADKYRACMMSRRFGT